MAQAPHCIGIILDGNRRWATERGLPTLEGHRRGLDMLIECARWARDAGVKHLSAFMFSTENWQREVEEVSYLMNLFRDLAAKKLEELGKENMRVRFVGQRERFAPDLQKIMLEVEQKTAGNTGVTLWACMSYGGRAEIVAAANAAMQEGKEVTEESLDKKMWTAQMPEPDIIIRTGGEQRLSGFLIWKGVYSELFFVDTKWPDFSKEKLGEVIAEFSHRQRRMGK